MISLVHSRVGKHLVGWEERGEVGTRPSDPPWSDAAACRLGATLPHPSMTQRLSLLPHDMRKQTFVALPCSSNCTICNTAVATELIRRALKEAPRGIFSKPDTDLQYLMAGQGMYTD